MNADYTPTQPSDDAAPSKTPFEIVAELTRLYGGADKVPEELLAKNGYERREDGTLAPLGLEVKKLRTLEEKNADKPFEPFAVKLNGEKSPRRLDWAKIGRIEQLQERIDSFTGYYFDNYLENIASNEVLERSVQAKKLLMSAGGAPPFESALRGSILYSLIDFYPESKPARVAEGINAAEGINEGINSSNIRLLDMVAHIEDEAGDFISKRAVISLSDIAERERGKVTDIEEIYKDFDESLVLDKSVETYDKAECSHLSEELISPEWWEEHSDEEFQQEIEKLLADLKERGIETRGQYIMYMVGKALDELYPGTKDESYSVEAIKIQGTEEMAKFLHSVEQQQLEVAQQRLKDAKAKLKTISFGDEGRTEAENELTQAKRALKEVRTKILPLREAFERPRYVAHKANQAYDALSDILMGGTDGVVELTFVSDVDTELDENPGWVSGDCTEGAPLPFLNADNGLYNVKVFREGEHVGNIYLLQIDGKKSGKPIIWHLDAIQIPQYLDWNKDAKIIVAALKEQAQKKGIKFITTNHSKELISNYDYISEAFAGISSPVDSGKLTNTIKNAARRTSVNSITKLQATHEDTYLEL